MKHWNKKMEFEKRAKKLLVRELEESEK